MKRPVMTELATFQCLLTSSVFFSRGVAPRSVRSLPVALEPMTTSLFFQRSGQALRLAGGAQLILPQEILKRISGEARVRGGDLPIDVEEPIGIHGQGSD